MEKIISEFRVIETDDGYRIEIKGDKERIKSFMSGAGGRRQRHHRHGGRAGFGWGPFGLRHGPMMWMKAAGCCGPWDFEGDDEEEAEEASTA